LTLVLPKSARVPDVVTAAGPTVAVRMPSHPVALALIRAAGVPVAAPSANRFGHVSPTQAAHVLADLEGRIDLILDGGPTEVGVESTVLSLVTPEPTILRPGGLSREALAEVLGTVRVLDRPVSPEEETVPAPGTLPQHYAPRARLTLYRGPRADVLTAMHAAARSLMGQDARVGVLVAQGDVPTFADLPVVCQVIGAEGELAQMARRLYGCLRALDREGVSVILARDVGVAGLGLAIRDRLTRAASRVVVVPESSQRKPG
jgi:L-threonylcarbamoyladenylate synthase